MLLTNWKTSLTTVLCAAAFSQLALAQVAPPTILQVDVENLLGYLEDSNDFAKFATDPNATTSVQPRDFGVTVAIGDIVAVNGQPARGTLTRVRRRIELRRNPNATEAIADTVRAGVSADTYEILRSDGTPVGTIVTYGLMAGSPAPGAPLSITQANYAIVGGTGAFFGARGQLGQIALATPSRAASITEDPANRRTYGGGKVQYVLHIIAVTHPEIVNTPAGPAVVHSDFSPVTAANPAKAGEVLIMRATGLGPTVPGVNPGQPFPTDGLQQVNSPVAVTMNGQAAEVVNGIGWPGLVDTYRVDFRVPGGVTAGTAAIQLSAAWIAGSPVNIPIQ
jgi:uncharacterized protein (TIGR03437 family)